MEVGTHVTGHGVPQGEDRDTSDEEWEAAYAALDPLEQIGFGNRRVGDTTAGGNLVRDILAAADAVHDNAMSEMDGNTVMDEEIPLEGAADASGEVSTTWCRGANAGNIENMDLDCGGETANNVLCRDHLSCECECELWSALCTRR